MFTGIVVEVGTVTSRQPTPTGARLAVAARTVLDDLSEGDSVAINGACMTAIDIGPEGFAVDVVHESLGRTNLGDLTEGASVNLERPLAASGRLDGHFVQGHVDGVGTVVACSGGDEVRMRIEVPADLAPYMVEKGSVTVDGVSLTITDVAAGDDEVQWFEVALIPHTLEVTVLGSRDVGSRVNIEVDVLAKYVERVMEARR
jgi:riboflavin synthase